MSDGNWNEVVSDYKFAQNESWGKDFIWMEKLVLHLLSNRDLSKFYPITSHYVLSFSKGNSFDEIYDKSFISIELSHEIREHIKDKFRYKFSLTTGNEDGDIFRQYVESVFCSFERSLEVFDEFVNKLEKL